jgi:general nucleoside transport system ATP-binding protein
VLAVDDVSLAFEVGEIHAVVGENGAGKTTLLRIAAGLVAPDQGKVLVDGAAVSRADRGRLEVLRSLRSHASRHALRGTVTMVEQHFALAGALSALDNVMLGAEPVKAFGRLDRAAARARADAVAHPIGAVIPWDAPVESLGVGDRQRLEIVRALVRDARVVILDEPTAVLGPGESRGLYSTLRRMADSGRAVVVVTHRLDEVRDHADRVSVLRRGRLASSRMLEARDEDALRAIARDVMGRAEPARAPAPPRPIGQVRIEVREARRAPGLRGVTLTVRAGEIVGIAGVDGNGQRELVRAIAGLEPLDAGEVRVRGVAVVHEDREVEGLVLDASVRENLVLGELAEFTRFGLVDRRSLEREATARRERAGVEPPDLDLSARALSGGNQQKIVVARALARAPRVTGIVMAQPTRGVDRAATAAIHDAIVGAAGDGKAVLLLSADLDELRALCDRILVLARGRIEADLPPDAAEARFGEAMLGASSPGVRA